MGQLFKGIVHLNTIRLYMKFNQICNLNHPIYWKLFIPVLSYMYVSTCYCLYYHSYEWLNLEENFLKMPQNACLKVLEQYHNMASFPVWLHIQNVSVLTKWHKNIWNMFHSFNYVTYFSPKINIETNLKTCILVVQKQFLIFTWPLLDQKLLETFSIVCHKNTRT